MKKIRTLRVTPWRNRLGNTVLGDTERSLKLPLNSRRQRYGSTNIKNNMREGKKAKSWSNIHCIWCRKATGTQFYGKGVSAPNTQQKLIYISVMPTYGSKNTTYNLVI
jgi:hypothetical protein